MKKPNRIVTIFLLVCTLGFFFSSIALFQSPANAAGTHPATDAGGAGSGSAGGGTAAGAAGAGAGATGGLSTMAIAGIVAGAVTVGAALAAAASGGAGPTPTTSHHGR